MATYRYYNVRREIFEKCSEKKLHKLRSFADMKRLFKVSYWIMLIGMILFALILMCLLLFRCNPLLSLIPLVGMTTISIVSELSGYKMYNAEARSKEWEEQRDSLDEYIKDVNEIFESHKITSREQRDALKRECEEQIKLHDKNFKSISNKAYDMLIGVPFGALISALIYKSSETDIMISSIVCLIIIGLAIIVIARVFKVLAYYSEGHFKDQYLLNVLNELEYLDN